MPDPPPTDPAPPTKPQPQARADVVTPDERNLALLAHLLGLITSVFGPLIIWLARKDQSAFVAHQGREALNFQITIFLAYVASSACVFAGGVGCFFVPVVVICDVVFCIIATVAASRGEYYRYPVALRLIR